ncbi:MAG: PKD domain-containing protein [Putridiphycobacter sp.]
MKKLVLLFTSGLFTLFSFAQGDDCFNATHLGTLPTPPACGTGSQVATSSINYNGTTVGATAENPYSSLTCMDAPAADVWVSFTASGNEMDLTFTSGLNDANIGIYTGDCTTGLTGLFCEASNNGNISTTITPLEPGATYYMQISGIDETDFAAFNLQLTAINNCDICAQTANITVTPPPTNGFYLPNTTVQFCFELTEFNQVSANWISGVVPILGSSWNAGSMTPVSAPTAGSGYVWTWDTHPTLGEGFFVDDDDWLFGPDGDLTNNYGDPDISGTGSWEFCYQVTTSSSCTPSGDLGITIETYSDYETGGYGTPGCSGDPTFPFSAFMMCCEVPTTSFVDPSCDNTTDGSVSATGQGGTAPYDYVWTDAGGNIVAVDNNLANGVASTAAGLGNGTYTAEVTDASGCVQLIDVTIAGPPCPPCFFTGISANSNITCPSSTYSTTGTLTFSNPPTTGTLTVSDCNGFNQQFTAPFSSPINYTITGQTADGLACDITAVFSADPACTITSNYTAPICPCNITNFVANIGNCDAATDTYGVSGTVEFDMPPSTGTLVISVNNGTTTFDTIINAVDFVSPLAYSISGISSDGAASTITATFSSDGACTSAISYTAPASCACPADIGTFTQNMTGSGNTDYVLCFNDEFNYQSNGDYTPPADIGDGDPYNPGIAYLIYSCPPTAGLEPNVDPCIEGIAVDGTGNLLFNDINDGAGIFDLFPAGTFTNNTVYYVPITMYDIVNNIYSNVILPNPSCYELGPAIAVQYLPEVKTTEVEDCQAGTITSTITGGLPEIDGSNYNIVPGSLTPSNASFVNTSTGFNGTITIQGLTNGQNYSYNIVDANGCPVTVSGTFIGTEDPTFTYDNLSICTNGTNPNLLLTGTPGGTFSYSVVSGGPTLSINTGTGAINVAGSNPGVYDITYTTPDAICFSTSTIQMTILEVPTVNPLTDQTVCDGDNFTAVSFSGTPATGVTYDWTNNNTTIGLGASGTGNISGFTGTNAGTTAQTGLVTVTPTLGTCVGTPTTFNLIVNPIPVVNAGVDQTVCEPLTVTLTATNPNAAIINWDNGVTDGVAFASPIGATTTYTVTATLAGCVSTDQVDVTVNPLPTVNAGTDQTVCEGTAVTLTATNPDGATITWDNGVTDGVAFTPAVGTTTYTVTADLLTCISTDQVDVTVNPNPVFTVAGTDPTTCGGNDGFIDINGLNPSTTYQVTYTDNGTVTGPTAMTSDATGTITINGLTQGNYTDFIVSLNTCATTDNTVINLVDPSAPGVNAGTDQTVCEGTAVTLTATNPSGATITWDNGVTDGVAFTPAVGTVTYAVTANLAGCISTDQVDVTVNPLPTVNAGTDQTVCEGTAVTLTATNPDGATITWDNGVTDGVAFTPAVGTTTYTVTADLLTCISTDQVDVTVNPNPVFTVAGTDPTTCGGNDGFIDINGLNPSTTYQVTYTDNGTVTGPTAMTSDATGTITINGLTQGNYTDFIVSLNACPTTDNTVINLVDPSAPGVNAGTDQTVCEGTAVTLTATNPSGATITWDNGVTDGVAFTPAVGTVTYTVTANLAGCISTDQVDVTVNPLPIVNAGTDQTVCEGTAVTLTATNPDGATITWDNGVTDGVAFTPAVGTTTYTVTADLLTCISTDQVDVTVNPNPVFTVAGTDPTTCGGNDGFIDINGLNPSTTYQVTYTDNGTVTGPTAMTSDATGTITINGLTQGNYTDFIVSLNACPTTDNTAINLVDPSAPTVNAGVDQTVCEPLTVTLTATNPDGAIISWDNGVTDGVAFASPIGATTTYTVTANLAGCITTDQVDVTVNPLPTIGAGTDQTVCEGTMVNLIATNPDGASISWDNGVTDGFAFTPAVGTVTYTVTGTLLGCVSTDQVDITVNPLDNPGFNYPAYAYCTAEANPVANIDVPGGTFSFTATAGGPNLSINTSTGEIDLANSNPGTYDITYTTTGLCPQDSTITMNIALTPTVDPVTDQEICHATNFSIINFTGSFGSTFDWVNDNTTIGLGANGSGDIPAFTGTNTSGLPQVANITVTPSAGTCVGTPTSFTLTVNPLDNPGMNYAPTAYCTTDANPIPTIDVVGGTFTYFTTNGTGTIDLNPSTGEINLVNSSAGSYDITYTTSGVNCPQDSTINITINLTPTIDPVADQTICDNTNFSLIDFTGTGNPNFDWTNDNTNIGLPANGSGDILPFTGTAVGSNEVANITVTPSTATCVGASTSFVLTVQPLDNPGFNYTNYNYCSTDTDPTANVDVTGGIFTAVATSGGPNLVFLDNTTGLIDLDASDEGVYDVTYTTTGACPLDSTVSITINFTPTVNTVFDQTICHNDAFSTVSFSGTNGLLPTTYDWTNNNTSIGLGANGTGDISGFTGTNTGTTLATGLITVTPSTAECVGTPTTFNLNVNPFDDASFQYNDGLTYCATGTVDPTVNITGNIGGAFSFTTNSGGPNLVLNMATGTIDLSASDVGSYDITYTTTDACPQSSTLTLVITTAPVADFTLGEYCANDLPNPLPNYINNGSGGVFTSTGGLVINSSTGQVDLAASTPGTYTVTNTIDLTSQGCALATATDDIIIHELPTAAISGTTTICPNDPLPDVQVDFTNAANGPFNFTYTFNGSSQTVNGVNTPHLISNAQFGSYELVSVTDNNGCTNTANGTVLIDSFPTPNVDYIPDYDVCEGDNLTIPAFTPGTNTYQWSVISGGDLGFGTNGNGTIGMFTGMNPSTSVVQVTPTSANGCPGPSTTFNVTVNLLPDADFYAPVTEGCEPFEALFIANSIDTNKCFWDFGDGHTGTGCGNVTHTYTTSGTYDVTLQVLSPDSCITTLVRPGYITVTPTPVAAFSYTPQNTDVSHTEVEFTNSSLDADDYIWDFGDESAQSNEVDPIHEYPEVPGQYLITLIASNNNGVCADTAEAYLNVDDILLYYVPNVFTPDFDDYNQTFQPVFTSGYDIYDYHLMIFNRWGELIFESYNAAIGWNGTYPESGELCQDGVYVWKIDFKESMSDKRHNVTGHVTLLK